MYLDKKMGSPEIAEKLDVCGSSVIDWLEMYGVRIRTRSEARRPDGKQLSEEELKRMYVDERMPISAIARKIGAGISTARGWLCKYKIPRRSRSEAALSADFVEPIKEQLERWYVAEGKNISRISEETKIPRRKISSLLGKCGIPKKNLSEAQLPHFVQPTKEQLCQWYSAEKHSAKAIAEKLGVTDTLIYGLLRKYKIPVNNPAKTGYSTKRIQPVSKEQLQELYVGHRKTIEEVGKELGVSKGTAKRWLHQYGIPSRDYSEVLLPAGFVKPTKEQLNEMYVSQRLSTLSIAAKLKISDVTVTSWLKKYNIPIRPAGERRFPAGFVKPAKEQLEILYYGEGLSLDSIGDKFGVSNSVIKRLMHNYKIPIKKGKRKENFVWPTKQQLAQWYFADELTLLQIGRKVGVTSVAVKYWFDKYNMPLEPSDKELGKNALKDLLKTYVGKR